MTPPSPPPGTPAPAPERRLAVLLSHLRPSAPARLGSAEPERLVTAAAAEEAGLSASPCAGGEGKGESSGSGRCVFCNIVSGVYQAFKLYEDDVCLCILDAKPLTPGLRNCLSGAFPNHSKKPLPNTANNTTNFVIAAICSKLPLLGTAIMKATQCDAFNVLVNNGEKAGQDIFHTYSRDPLSHNQETKDLVSCIKEALSSSPEDYSTVTPSTPKEP
ncbi:hypothetical protein ACP70R_020610 [Stipagrostis hirtigluma subsp. patula]